MDIAKYHEDVAIAAHVIAADTPDDPAPAPALIIAAAASVPAPVVS
jgi:hypothetical protein